MQGSRIFEGTDFDDDGLADGIHFGILGMEVENTPPASGSFYDNQFISVLEFLNEHSTADWSQYCLSYRFTSRDFDNGVVGLAFVAPQPGVNAAGVCVCVGGVWSVGVCGWVCGTLVFEILTNTNKILMNGYCRQSFFNSYNG